MNRDDLENSLRRHRILITGASGFIGSHLCRRLVTLGAEVHGVSRSARGDMPGPTRWWQVDLEKLTDVESLWDAVKPSIVYHLSGTVNGAPRLDLLLPTFHSLLTTTVNLLHVSTDRGCDRVIVVGSLEEEGLGDGSAPPASPYAAAKTAAREYVRMCHELFGLQAVMLRLFMGYGPGQPEWKLIPHTIRALVDGVSPAVSSGRRQLDWIYIDDIVDAFLTAAVAPGIEGKTLDIGTGRLTSVREVVENLVRLVNPAIEPCFGKLADRPERPARAADTAYTLRHLGWEARMPLEDGLKLTVQSYRKGLAP
jgi:nucleoside-diphosphate-sugar epimerase